MSYGGSPPPGAPNAYDRRKAQTSAPPPGQGNAYDVMGGYYPVNAPGGAPPGAGAQGYPPQQPPRPGYAGGYRPVPVRPGAPPAGYPAGRPPYRPPGAPLAVPPRGGPPAPARPPPPPKKKTLAREEMTFYAIGFALIAIGVILALAFNPLMGATNADSFLTSSGAQFASNPAAKFVELNPNDVTIGSTVLIHDQIGTITYNATAGVTVLTFTSIPTGDSTLTALATALFGVYQGDLTTTYSVGQWVDMTYQVVRASQPGDPNATYVTLDGSWLATHTASIQGYSGLQAEAVNPAYMQPYPAPLYEGLFIAMIAAGAGLLAIVMRFPKKVSRFFKAATKDPQWLVTIMMFILGCFALVFLPFYPWWMVLVFSGILALISIKFPQLAVIVLGILMVGEVGYQAPELGMIFIIALLPVLAATLFDWRIGVGALFVLSMAPYGLSFVAPIFVAMIFSLFLGIAIAVAGGLLTTLFVTLGNFPFLGWLVGGANGSPSFVDGHPQDLNPVLWNWSVVDFGQAFGNITSPNSQVLTAGVAGLGALVWSLVEIATWCFACYMGQQLILDRTKMTRDRWLWNSTIGGGVIAAGALVAMVKFDNLDWFFIIALVAIVPAMLTITAASMVVRESFQGYFTSKMGGASVGSRVSEMKGLSKISFEMVGGLSDVKADIKESMIIPLMRKDITSKFGLEPPKGILLFGPPGCGKTMLMKALANELGVEMIAVKCSDLMSKWYGESEGKVSELFKTAKERAPCILFMDEVDALAKRRDLYSADDVSPRLLSIMLSDMDGMDKASGVIIVATTNKPEMIDPAMMRPGRLDKIIYVPPPDFNERADVIKVHLFGKPVANDIDLAEIAKKTERFSGADLANLVREVATLAMKRSMMTGMGSIISMEDFRTVLPRMKPSISLRMIEEYERLKMDFERKMHQVQRAERKVVVKWDDVGGLEDIKKALKEYVELPLTKPELMEEYKLKTGRGILLFGPPGCGKTHIMRAASNELNVPIQIVNGPELVSALAGQSEAAVRDILYRARENSPSIVFFDEIDALASKDSMKTPEVSRAVSQFLTEMDGIKPKDRVIIVATTNRPQILDPALLRPGRFDKIFYVPPPDLRARADIFKIQIKGVPIDGEVDFDLLALGTEGYSGADIASIVDEAKLIALREQLRADSASIGQMTTVGRGSPATAQLKEFIEKGGGNRRVAGVKMSNLLEAVGRTKSSITPETLEWAQSFIQTYGTRQ